MTPALNIKSLKIKPKPGMGPVSRLQLKKKMILEALFIQEKREAQHG